MRARLCSPAVTTARRCSVAEQCGRDHSGRIVAVEPDRDRAGLDRDEQPVRAGLGRREARRDREAVDSARAAQTEDRNAADVIAKSDLAARARFQARRCDSGGGDGHDAVDLLGHQAGFFDRGARCVDEQALGRFQIERVAVMPAVRMHVPIRGSDDVSPGNAGIVEDAGQTIEQRLVAAECLARTDLRFALFNDMGRYGSRKRQEAAGLHHMSIEQGNRSLVQIFSQPEAA